MKTSKFFFLGLLSLAVAFSSCSSDDDDTPPAGTCATPTNLIIDNATASSVTLSWTSTGTAWTIEYGVAGFTQGSGTQVEATTKPFTINGLNSNTEYNFYVRNNCTSGASGFSSSASIATPTPLVGSWTAYDVSAVLTSLGITAVTADFASNNSYTVVATAGGAESALSGNYTVSEPNSEGIYEITLNQTSPNSLVSEGIFKVFAASPDSMWYEVAQTDPGITGVTPPTVEGGFGSTSGGAFGTMNIQKYNRQ